jgi:hypothetical protein
MAALRGAPSTLKNRHRRACDDVVGVARLCARLGLPHIINNAYGVQSRQICAQITAAARRGRVDAVVQSTDKARAPGWAWGLGDRFLFFRAGQERGWGRRQEVDFPEGLRRV